MASLGLMQDTGSLGKKKKLKKKGRLGLVHWDDHWDGMGRELGGGFRMGNKCTPLVDAC